MPLYTPGRRRAIILLLLTSILLVTLDLRGNAVFDAARTGFNTVLEPVENAAEVVTRPVQNAWRGITNYEDVAEENRELREQLEAQRADQVVAEAVIVENQELLALNDLESLSEIPTLVATVVGQTPTNLDQIIEINKGSDDGVEVGMAVVTAAGLVGKVTAPVAPDRARVMLVSDVRYAVDVKIVPAVPPPPPTTTTTTTIPPFGVSVPPETGSEPADSGTVESTPASAATSSTTPDSVPEEATGTGTSAPPTSTPDDGSIADGSVPPGTVDGSAPPTTAPLPTTTTLDLNLVRETGGFTGQGEGSFPQVNFLDQTPDLGRFEEGDYVFTSGSETSLAPANIPIGRIVNVVIRSTSEGPLLEVEPFADLDRLYFVRVVLYQPRSEVPLVPTPTTTTSPDAGSEGAGG
ncbi:MAG: rod shape-determining protein MreC [Actinomycetota bacterium]|nr:rod shape-determining protein MreC [Actinomycetota bacterium]